MLRYRSLGRHKTLHHLVNICEDKVHHEIDVLSKELDVLALHVSQDVVNYIEVLEVPIT